MKSDLVELIEVSSYMPKEGYVLELYNMAQEGKGRNEMQAIWTKRGRTKVSFRQSYKKLKDRLLREAFLQRGGLGEAEQKRIECWDKYSKVRSLLIANKRLAALSLATETIKLAQRCGFTEILLNLSLILETNYASIAPDTQKYLRYRRIRKLAASDFSHESEAGVLYAHLTFHYLRKKDYEVLSKEIEEINEVDCQSTRFIQLRCSILSLWYQLKNDYSNFSKILKNTLSFYEKKNDFLAYSTMSHLYVKFSGLLIAQKNFEKADLSISKGLAFPKAGTYSYQQILIQRGLLGLHSGNPEMAFDAWKRSSYLVKYDNQRIKEVWHIIRAYIHVYEELGLIKTNDKFKVGKFQNSVSELEQDKQDANVSIIIANMLICLLNGNKIAYMKKAEGISAYAHKHLRGKEHARKRSILYMLKKVEEADYYKLRTELRVGRWKKQLKDNPLQIVDFSEIMPYEKVWEIILSQLK